jgi:hypothetical protein
MRLWCKYGLQAVEAKALKLLCHDDHIAALVQALAQDNCPAVLMERTGIGWRVEFLRPAADCNAVQALIDSGKVSRAP